MAPREVQKSTPKKVQSTLLKKTNGTKIKASPVVLKKAISMSSKKTAEKALPMVNNTPRETRQRTSTVPKVATPKPKVNNTAPVPGSVTKSVKKAAWNRRPKPAHSGVPVPEKMRKLFEKQSQELDCSL